MDRKPHVDVRRTLRNEVGFGCPVPVGSNSDELCGNPYLEWHHFDPPWHVEEHHNPEGMLALCVEHHKKADGGAYTKSQLQQFKRNGISRRQQIKGRFDWLRNKLLVVAGGNFFFETYIVLQIRNHPIIWLNKDENGYLLLNVAMATLSTESRLRIEDNFWIEKGRPLDLESPPSGKSLTVRYENGDYLKVEFYELENRTDIQKRYPDASPEGWPIEFPITAVEVHYTIAGTIVKLSPREFC